MIQDYFKIASRNLRIRKTRSLLTVLGIFLGIVTIFVLMSLSLGLRGFVNEQFELLGGDKFFVQPKGQAGPPGGSGGAVQLTIEDSEIVESTRGVEEVAYFTIGNTKIEYRDQERYYTTLGVPVRDRDKFNLVFETFGLEAEDGRMLKKGDKNKVLVGYNYKYRDLFSSPVKPGDKFKLNGKDFEVIGILSAIGNPADDQQIYISVEDFEELFNSSDRVDFIMAQIKGNADMSKVAEDVERKLRKFRDVDEKTQDFDISTPEELLGTFSTVLNGITGFLLIVALISAIVGGIGIANTMYTSVLERKKEIGTMKAIGARNRDILGIFVIEASILGLIGGFLGVLIGIAIAKTIEYVIVIYVGADLLRASLNPLLIIISLAFGLIVGILSGFLPSYQASKLKPVDTLRYE
ncbi:ABC transporter permease [Candidatus Pacearchaeota archaeon]|nr:ABC transporter permease [Candidatus Pacearchaeota archaeon]|tara:strand:+ start:451 stop:1674 length:1224 start_codon:yes stop_codon:yes gene_type:complete